MKRRKTIRAGRLVWDVIYTVPRPNASQHERKRIRAVTAEQVAQTNCNTAQRKLEMLMATNFEPDDLVFTATYRDEDLPASPDVTRRRLTKVFAQIRAYRKARGLPELKYIYVLEGRHGDHRPHVHIVMNAVGNDLELVKSLWIWGDNVDMKLIGDRGYDVWAGYFTKERREASLNGKKQYVGSRNLKRPSVTYEWVDDGAMIDPPPGVQVIDDSGIKRNEYASCRYIKYMLPKPKNNKKLRARTRVVADLEWPVTSHTGMEKKPKPPRQTRKTAYNKRQGVAND